MLIYCSMTNFSDWLENQIRERGISPADLSRSSGKAPAILSRVLNGERNPAPETIAAICNGLGIPVEEGYRAAGLIPFKQKADEAIERGKHTLENYRSPETRERALEYLEFLRVQEEKGEYDVKPEQKKKQKNHEESLKKALGD